MSITDFFSLRYRLAVKFPSGIDSEDCREFVVNYVDEKFILMALGNSFAPARIDWRRRHPTLLFNNPKIVHQYRLPLGKALETKCTIELVMCCSRSASIVLRSLLP